MHTADMSRPKRGFFDALRIAGAGGNVVSAETVPCGLEGCRGKKQGCRLGEKRRVHDRLARHIQSKSI